MDSLSPPVKSIIADYVADSSCRVIMKIKDRSYGMGEICWKYENTQGSIIRKETHWEDGYFSWTDARKCAGIHLSSICTQLQNIIDDFCNWKYKYLEVNDFKQIVLKEETSDGVSFLPNVTRVGAFWFNLHPDPNEEIFELYYKPYTRDPKHTLTFTRPRVKTQPNPNPYIRSQKNDPELEKRYLKDLLRTCDQGGKIVGSLNLTTNLEYIDELRYQVSWCVKTPFVHGSLFQTHRPFAEIVFGQREQDRETRGSIGLPPRG